MTLRDHTIRTESKVRARNLPSDAGHILLIAVLP
jgi:hypothetical protein